MKEILLTKGQVALVDDDDFDYLNKYKWQANYNKHTKSYYARRTIGTGKNKKNIRMHRQILGLINYKNNDHIDHEDHNTLNNQKYNLRIVTNSKNHQNQLKRSNSISKYKGVCLYNVKGKTCKWVASIRLNNKGKYLGRFNIDNEIDAARAYDKAAIKYFGEYALINFPEDYNKYIKFLDEECNGK